MNATRFTTKQSRRQLLIEGARATAAAALLATLVLGTSGVSLAAPSPSRHTVDRSFQEGVIVPRGGETAEDEEENDDDIAGQDEQSDAELESESERDDDVDNGNDTELVFTADEEDPGSLTGGEDSDTAAPIRISGIGKPGANLSPNEWQGAMDGRLVEPFASAPRPRSLTIGSINVHGTVSIGDIVGGEMQTPKDESDIVWYKETGRLGENRNLVFAAHLNWYGVPEAIFYDIDKLQEGDEIVVTGEDGQDYTYEVTWVKLVPTATTDLNEIVGQTSKPSVTLITCGGTWDGSAGQYKDRTVVRAELVTNR